MNKKQRMITGFLAAIIVAAGVVVFMGLGRESTDDATIEAHVVAISAKVSGYIAVLNVRDNQPVARGDVLLEIDPIDYELNRDAAMANLASAQVNAENAKMNADRQQALGRRISSQKEIDNAMTALASTNALVESAKAQLAVMEKQLSDTKVTAPEDGVVTMRVAEKGAYVMPGQNLMSLVGAKRWVVANFKEVQITDMRVGQQADISVDAYPDLRIKGRVDSIQSGTGARFSAFPPENATGNFVKIVQRVPVKITFDTPIPAEIVLGAGLSVHVKVHTDGDAQP